MPETEELRLRGSPRRRRPSPTRFLRHVWAPPLRSNGPRWQRENGKLPAKQKKLNCGSADQTEHSTHAQLSPSSKGALRLASVKKKKMKKTQLQSWYSGQKGQVEFSQCASELAIIPWPQSSAWGFSLTGVVRLLKEDLRVSGEQSSCRLSSTCQSVDGPQHNHCRWSTTTLCKGQARQNPLFPQTQTTKKSDLEREWSI